MSDHEAAALAVLAEVMPIGDDDHRVVEFGDAVAEHVAQRPSPAPAAPVDPVLAALQVVSGQLMTVIHQNAAIVELLGGRQ